MRRIVRLLVVFASPTVSRTMRRAASWIIAAALLSLASKALAQKCRAADAVSAFMLNGVKHMMTGVDANVASERRAIHLPLIAADSVVLVMDESVCARMATAYSGALSATKTPSGRVYVVKVGSVYVVRDPAIVMGEYTLEMVITDKGAVLARYGS